ncbi:MAG: leucine-rich repeat domain-containing protein [Clostridia bacterium]|nr:leucine-rich repeat domain-containing protein [Clostridia bacterium]
MKRIIATVLSAIVGLFGYTIVDTAIDSRVSELENRVEYLESVVEEYHKTTAKPAVSTTKKVFTTTKKPAATTTAASTEICVIADGTCGKTTTWKLYSDGLLVISGEGRMDACTAEFDVPIAWDNYRSMIRRVTIESGITYIGFGAFSNCDNLESIKIPDTVTEIGSFAFKLCKKIKSIEIPASVEKIGAYAFSGCTVLEHIIIPDSVKEIDSFAFEGCANLGSITFGTNIKEIPDGAFSACGLNDVYYKGTQEQWNEITVGENNVILDYVTIHYNYSV